MEGVPAGDEGELQSMEHMGAGHEAAHWWEKCQCLLCDVVPPCGVGTEGMLALQGLLWPGQGSHLPGTCLAPFSWQQCP